MQGRSTGAELLEHHQVDTVGVDLERNREVLPAEVGAESVDNTRKRSEKCDRERVGFHIGGGEQAGLELLAQHRK